VGDRAQSTILLVLRHRAGHIASPGGISNGLGNYGTGRDLQYGTTLTRTMRPSSDDARAIARLG
jgi:hypothetical protein